MGRQCSFPNCNNKQKTWSPVSFHKLPLNDTVRCKLWLQALQIKPNTSTRTLRRRFILVCSDHFSPDDLIRHEGSTYLTSTAVPYAAPVAVQTPAGSPNVTASSLQDDWVVMDRPSGQFRNTGLQVNLPEKSVSTTEKPTPQYVVDEEAILQLMKTCPVCNRKCRCSKHTRGPYLIVYQSCYFCDYQRKWASQPEAKNMNIHKAQTLPKRKLPPKDKVNAKAHSSQLNRTRETESSASESHNPSDT